MFESGFCWIKVDGYSYVAKIVEKESEGFYTVSLDNIVFKGVPISEMSAIYGDTDWRDKE